MRQRFKQWRRSARNREAAAYDSYTRLAAYPLFLLGMLFLIAFAITLTPDAPSADLSFARVVIPVTWFAFAADYVISIALAPHRWRYVRAHLLQLAALLFPPLRILMVGHVFYVMRAAHVRRGDRARTYVLYSTTLLLVAGAVLVVYFESKDPAANITSFGNALWWGGETVSTVGYGDFYPVTVGGRLVAAVLFVNGVALLSIITAGLAQNFTSDDAAEASGGGSSTSSGGADPQPTPTGDSSAGQAMVLIPSGDVQALHDRLDRLEQTLSRIADRVGTAVAGLPAAPAAEGGAGGPAAAPRPPDTPTADTPGDASAGP